MLHKIGSAIGDELCGRGVAFPNVHLGVSCEDQETADERIPLLAANARGGAICFA